MCGSEERRFNPRMSSAKKNSFGTRTALHAGNESYDIYRLSVLGTRWHRQYFAPAFFAESLCSKIYCATKTASSFMPRTFAPWRDGVPFRARRTQRREKSHSCLRVCCCRISPGVPAVVDLAAMREAMRHLGGNPKKINPLLPAELVIDHSVQVDKFGRRGHVRIQRRPGNAAQHRTLRISALGSEEDFRISR